jgi:hypothetical protein
MPFVLPHHQHEAHEYAATFAAWQGYQSRAALALPRFVAQRTRPIPVREVQIP